METFWISKVFRKMKSDVVACIFTDWRQLAATITALQCGGFIFRGIVVWDKGNSRNIPHRFRNNYEYIVWGTKGERPAKPEKGINIYPGC